MAKPKAIQSVSGSKHMRIGLYSDPGIGKTRFLGSSPGKVLVIRPPTDHTDSMLPADKQRVEEWVVHSWNDLWDVLDYARHEGHEWDWIWLDSLSLLQDHLLDDLWETVLAEKPARARYGLDKAEYGVNMFRIGQWLRYMVGPDTFNFGFTAHAANLLPSEDPEEELKLMPWIQGKNMSPKCCGYMNVVAFLEAKRIGGEDKRRVIRLDATERYYAKDQFDLTKDGRLIDPTMPKLVALREAKQAQPPRKRRTINKKGS